MASPQLENGYTPVANEILDKIACLPLNGTQFRIITVVWRYTYGFSRKDHELSESFIANATGIHKKQIQREINSLISFNIIFIKQEATFKTPRILAFNKNYDCWQVAKKLPGNKLTPDSEIDTHTGSELAPSPGSGLVPQDNQDLKTNLKTKDLDDDVEYKTLLSPQTEKQGNNEPAVSNLDKLETIIIPELFGQRMASPLEIEAMKTSLVLTNDDIDFILAIVRKANQAYKPKFDGDKIKSFTYFLDIIKREWSAKQARDRPVDNIGNKKIFSKEMNYNGGAGTNRGDPSGDPIPISKLIIRADSDMSGVQT